MPRGAKPKFSPAQDQEIAARYRDGEPMRSIAESFGVSYIPVAAALKRAGVTPRERSEYYWQPTPENVAALVRLWDEGKSVRDIARETGIGTSRVSPALRDAGIQPRFGGTHHRFKGDEVDALMREYRQGASLNELARRHGGNTRVIANTLLRNGVQLRKKGYRAKFWTPERVAWLQAQADAGRSQGSIAKELGISQTRISRLMIDFGVRQPRPRATREEHGAWQGGRVVDGGGYIRVRLSDEDAEIAGPTINGGYIMEHRLVMARLLGRPLLPTETVHHINGDKTDNDPENLQLRQGKHGNGVVFQCAGCGSQDIQAVAIAEVTLS